MVPRNLRVQQTTTTSSVSQAQHACLMGSFPLSSPALGSWELATHSLIRPYLLAWRRKKILFSAAYPVTLSRPPPGFLGGFLLWMRGVVRTIQVRMYAPNKTLPESAWRVGHNREVDCICHPSLLSSFYFFLSFPISPTCPAQDRVAT